jgi:hypothetical protein
MGFFPKFYAARFIGRLLIDISVNVSGIVRKPDSELVPSV